MISITSIQQFVDLLASAGDRLVICEFYGQWCGACKGVYPKVSQLMREHPDAVLAKLDFDQTKPIAKAMGVRVLPYFALYRGAEGKVDAFSASLSKIDRLRSALDRWDAPRCLLPGLGPEGRSGKADGIGGKPLEDVLPANAGEEALNKVFEPHVRPMADLLGHAEPEAWREAIIAGSSAKHTDGLGRDLEHCSTATVVSYANMSGGGGGEAGKVSTPEASDPARAALAGAHVLKPTALQVSRGGEPKKGDE